MPKKGDKEDKTKALTNTKNTKKPKKDLTVAELTALQKIQRAQQKREKRAEEKRLDIEGGKSLAMQKEAFMELLEDSKISDEKQVEIFNKFNQFIKNNDERRDIIRLLEDFRVNKQISKSELSNPTESFKTIYKELSKNLKAMLKKPNEMELLKSAGEKSQMSLVTPEGESVAKVNKSKAQQKREAKAIANKEKTEKKRNIKTESNDLSKTLTGDPQAPVVDKPLKEIDGISNKKPEAGGESMEEQLKPPPSNNPSDVQQQSGSVNMGDTGNTNVITEMMGNTKLYNPEALQNTGDNPLIGTKGNVGIPPSSVAPDLSQPKRNIFADDELENQNVKLEDGTFIRRDKNVQINPEKSPIASLDFLNSLSDADYKTFADFHNLPQRENLSRLRKQAIKQVEPSPSIFKKSNKGIYTKLNEPVLSPELEPPKIMSTLEKAVRDAEQANEHLRKVQELQQANANREASLKIGYRENTGLATRVSVAGADIMTKPKEEVFKSVNTYANRNWIEEGARSNSTLGKNSSLYKMQETFDDHRYEDTFTPVIYMERDREDIVNEYKNELNSIVGKRFIPQYSGNYTQERIPQFAQGWNYTDRPIGSKQATFDNLYDYTYDHCCVYGSQNMGLAPMYPDMAPRIDFNRNHLIFPNTMRERATGIKKYF